MDSSIGSLVYEAKPSGCCGIGVQKVFWGTGIKSWTCLAQYALAVRKWKRCLTRTKSQ